MEHVCTDLPAEIIELVLVFVFESYVLEDARIQNQIAQYWLNKSSLALESMPKLESIFKRQTEIYKCVANSSRVSRPYWKLMQNSNSIWSRIFHLTIGARSWLSKAPYVFERRFKSSYREMCKFLMTFGDKLTAIKFEKLELDFPRVEKIGPSGVICSANDKKMWKYDLSTSEAIPLTNIEETEGMLLGKYLVTFGFEFHMPTVPMNIYDYEESRLLQSYDDVLQLHTEYGAVRRWTTKHIGDWIELTAEVGGMRREALIHKLMRISHHEVIDVPAGEEYCIGTIKETDVSFYRSKKNKKKLIDTPRVKNLKIAHNRVFSDSKELHPCTNEVLSTLPFASSCKLLGNYAILEKPNYNLPASEHRLKTISTSINAGRRTAATNGFGEHCTYYIRGDQLLTIRNNKEVYVHVLDY